MGAFRRGGFAGTSIQDLVDATGVGRDPSTRRSATKRASTSPRSTSTATGTPFRWSNCCATAPPLVS
jgi:hypothetical protein